MAALPFLKKKKIPCIFTGLVSLLSGYPSYLTITVYKNFRICHFYRALKNTNGIQLDCGNSILEVD
jgi:hypothetical protein